jgi:plasmid stabilization system protein ParE
MNYRVVFTPEAEEQLVALYGHIAVAASPDIAARYTEAIVGYCESLCTFPIAAPSAMTYDPDCASPITGNAP